MSMRVPFIPHLKRCPFCDAAAVMVSGGSGCHFVKCGGCGAASDDGSQERAVAKWNRRASRPASDTPDPRDEAKTSQGRSIQAAMGLLSRSFERAMADFPSDGNEEARWIEDTKNACTCCGGSGHKDDMRPDPRDEVMRDLRASLTELVSAMRRYQQDVDDEPPHQHVAMMDRARAALSKGEPDREPTHRHLKTGGLYRVLLKGKIEADLTEAVAYEAQDGTVWIRPAAEFYDGRFAALSKGEGADGE